MNLRLAILFLMIPSLCSSQVILNEVQSSNTGTINDDNGEYEDWIELHNPGDTELDIGGLVLKDNVDVWRIPEGHAATVIPPHGYFLLWADDEEIEGPFHTNFKLSASNGEYLGLFESDSVTEIESVNIPPLADNHSFGKCGGTTWNVLTSPTPLLHNDCSTLRVILSEIQSSNSSTLSDEWGDYDDWIELYNPNPFQVDIAGLVFKNNMHVWRVPPGDENTLMLPGSYLLIWADNEEPEGTLHANFRLSASESLIICGSDSTTVIDSILIPEITENSSYGMCPGGEWKIFSDPTPLEDNNCASGGIQTVVGKGFVVYPKIAGDKIFIRIPESLTGRAGVKLCSVSGAVLLDERAASTEHVISLEQYASGMYILLLSAGDTFCKERIIKSN